MPRPINVLAVDDTVANLLSLEAVLGDEYNIVRATSGPEALEILESRRDIDLILMDVQMPMLDGFETAALIKEMESARDIPIVFITAVYQDDPWVKKGYEVGAIDYFSKPFDSELLRLKVGIYATLKQRADFLKEQVRQRRVSEELLTIGRNLVSAVESLRVGAIFVDTKGHIREMNDAVSRIFKSSEPLEGDACGEMLGWWHNGHLIQDQAKSLSRAMHGESTSDHEVLQIRCVDGTEKTIVCSASPLRRSGGDLVGAVLIIQDMTEPKKIEEDLQQRITNLEVSD